jgi:putative endonuclease
LQKRRGVSVKRWAVYILRCGDGTLYTGATNDLDNRIDRHARGKGAAYTRSRLPVALVYSERAVDRSAALRREAALKKLDRHTKLLLIAGRPPKPRRARSH